jgi:hypothetical protein
MSRLLWSILLVAFIVVFTTAMLLPTMQSHIPSTFTITEIKWRDNNNNNNNDGDMHKCTHDNISIANSNDNATQQDGIVDSSFVESCVMDFDDEEIKPFELVPGWEYYRLGDCIKHCEACFSCYNGTIRRPDCRGGRDGAKLRNESFAKDYSTHHCPHGGPKDRSNLTGIEEVFQRRISLQQQQQQQHHPSTLSPYDILTVPDPDELVIHLRLGDVIEMSKANVTQMLLLGADPAHDGFKNSIKSVSEILTNIQESGLSKVSLRGGSHKPELYVKSRVYAGCLKQAIQQAGYRVKMSLDHTTPDQDFYYMSHASHFVVSTGGYSRLIGQLVEHRGGTIVGRNFQWKNDPVHS